MINIHKISLAYFLMAVLSTPVYAVTSDQGQASVAHEPTAQEPIVKISSGAVLGRVDDGVYAFKGIPYAQAERFMPPQPPDSWDGVRDASYRAVEGDRKRTRLNSSHVAIS